MGNNLKRLKKNVSKTQFSFMAERSITEAICTLRKLIGRSKEKKQTYIWYLLICKRLMR